ncbi:PREDICTED: calmodulin-binding receptor-like cytoplasmic kinase 3 isoform X1 [Populus euphratica]|uniref:non-specific serine/threonine protein kinase n=1 Tax=Populus euphratica TaxID=75702 RepID=A0AAJ6U027_POPEU|nr:PREDICTED: calmodulin-binding receptor-like cytoplasmic kinase 3 isoform X1 [Populus euphratica]XP_011020208.1 PREDICTED: calmodulin-binding receptor-like cytoplasmic kinase 3 isoform X1 [Populus euphratica]
MATAALIIFLLIQFRIILASGFVIQSKVCGSDHIAYSICHGHELFYINGELKEKESFCKALHSFDVNDCTFENYLGSSCSGLDLDLSLADSPLKPERSLLQKEVREESTSHDLSQDTSKEKTLSPPYKAGIGAAGVLVMCCTFLCPCLYKTKKATTHTVLEKDPKSTDSISPFNVNSASDKAPPSPHRVPPSPSRFSQSPKLSRLGSVHLNLNQVARATRNFSPSLQIGEGGFGTVYKAELDDGQVVAIKRAKKEHFANLRTEFSSEVELLAKIDHRNLVKLLGYVDKGNERLIITEYVPNGTLREHLDVQRGKILDFNQRLEISIDVAHGLTYLHLYAEKQIIHRDVKSSNILLTESMRAKVADFGFARMGPVDSDQTHISTKVKGTVGYLDPEYMRTYQLTPKSDVYSFGILLLEILTGRRPVEPRKPADERVTLRWVFKKYNEGNVVDMVDPLMEEKVDTEVLYSMFTLAIQCAAPIRSERPDMKVVVEHLWGIRADYLKGVKKG